MGVLHHKDRWYAGGLAFECIKCGACCCGPEEGYVWVNRSEIAAIAAYLHLQIKQIRRQYVRRVGTRTSLTEREDNNDCILLVADPDSPTGKTCMIYPVRPAQCGTWPFWPSNLATPARWAAAQLRCPGINSGPLHSLEHIETQRNATP